MSKTRVKCPFCGSKNTARIQYGYPLFSEDDKIITEGMGTHLTHDCSRIMM